MTLVSLSNDPYRPLEIELRHHEQHYVIIDGVQVQQPQEYVSLLVPDRRSKTHICLVNMTPQTALNLLTWLQEHEEELQNFLKKEQS